jgi:glycosyltransferase involved in cell wall biosynthesis
MSEGASTTHDPVNPVKWIALLGRQDIPTDGVEDYCTFLGRALATQGIEMKQARVAWMEKGWTGALRQLSRECAAWRGSWILLQYTSFMWSRRGFPFPALIVLALLRRCGARVAIVFHEPGRQGGVRRIDRLRGACQDWVIQSLYRRAAKSIFTVPLETVAWLPQGQHNATFIPIGANIPERVDPRSASGCKNQEKTVIVFGVTEAPNAAREVEEIAAVIRGASEALAKLRLVIVGRGSVEAQEQLARSLEKCSVNLVVRGVLSAEAVACEFERADVLLFVRGPINPRRGSALAGIASGLPIVGYRNGDIDDFLKDAGVEWSSWGDRDGLVRGLIRVLSDPRRWMDLHERNLEVQRNYLSWHRIAERFRVVLTK